MGIGGWLVVLVGMPPSPYYRNFGRVPTCSIIDDSCVDVGPRNSEYITQTSRIPFRQSCPHSDRDAFPSFLNDPPNNFELSVSDPRFETC